mmetsp:Transcript_72036/g.187486  ORF Transcript_72036/g.187486 Transcript_72036/m.187486 type:complete len:221 (-) Transcript_72036:229-891(-)
MVREEELLAGLQVAQSHPLRTPPSVILGRHVLAYVHRAVLDEGPRLLVVGHADRVLALESLVVIKQANRFKHPFQVFALLEAHDVEGLRFCVVLDQMSSTVSISTLSGEQIPPEEVVGQDLDLRRPCPRRGCPKRGRRGPLEAPGLRLHDATGPRAFARLPDVDKGLDGGIAGVRGQARGHIPLRVIDQSVCLCPHDLVVACLPRQGRVAARLGPQGLRR